MPTVNSTVPSPVRIVSWNVAAWTTTVAKIREAALEAGGGSASSEKALSGFLSQIKATVLCLQETKVTHKRVMAEPYVCGASEVNKQGKNGGATSPPIPGYDTFWATNKVSPGFNGVCTYAKEGCTLLADPRPLRVDALDDEGRCLLTVHKKFAVFNIYAPYSRDEERHNFKYQFYIALLKAMARVRSEFVVEVARDEDDGQNSEKEEATTPMPIILCGDFNLVRRQYDMHWTKWSIPLDYLITCLRFDETEDWWLAEPPVIEENDDNEATNASPASSAEEKASPTAIPRSDLPPPPPRQRRAMRLETQAAIDELVASGTVRSFENNDDALARHHALLRLAPFLKEYLHGGLLAVAGHLYNRYHLDAAVEASVPKEIYAHMFKATPTGAKGKPRTLASAMALIRFHVQRSRESFLDSSLLFSDHAYFNTLEQGSMLAAHKAIHVAEMLAAVAAFKENPEASASSTVPDAVDVLLRASGVDSSPFTDAMRRGPAPAVATASPPNSDSTKAPSLSSQIEHATKLVADLTAAVAKMKAPAADEPSFHTKPPPDEVTCVCVLVLLTGVCGSDPHMRSLVFGNLLGDIHANLYSPAASSASDEALLSPSERPEKAADPSSSSSAILSSRWCRSYTPAIQAEVKALPLPRLLDSFATAYPTAVHARTCWDQSRNGRISNYGTRIDYIFVDKSLTRVGRRGFPLLATWSDPLAEGLGLHANALFPPSDLSSSSSAALSLAEDLSGTPEAYAVRSVALGLESGRANPLPFALPTLPLLVLKAKSAMRNAVTAEGLYPSAAFTGEGMPPVSAPARDAPFVPFSQLKSYLEFWGLLKDQPSSTATATASSPTAFSPTSKPSLSRAQMVEEGRARFTTLLPTGLFSSPSQYSDHMGTVVLFGNLSEEDLMLLPAMRGGGAAHPSTLRHSTLTFSVKAGEPINVSRCNSLAEWDASLPAFALMTRECTFRMTQKTIMAMFSKMTSSPTGTVPPPPAAAVVPLSSSSTAIASKSSPSLAAPTGPAKADKFTHALSSSAAAKRGFFASAPSSQQTTTAAPVPAAASSSSSRGDQQQPAEKKSRVEVIDLDSD